MFGAAGSESIETARADDAFGAGGLVELAAVSVFESLGDVVVELVAACSVE